MSMSRGYHLGGGQARPNSECVFQFSFKGFEPLQIYRRLQLLRRLCYRTGDCPKGAVGGPLSDQTSSVHGTSAVGAQPPFSLGIPQ